MILISFREETSARLGDIVDYTRFRLSKRIAACKKCGRRGRIGTATTKVGKLTVVTHKKKWKGWYWIGPSSMDGIDTDEPDHCMYRAATPQKEEGRRQKEGPHG